MPKRYKRNCDYCGKFYIGQNSHFCSKECFGNYMKKYMSDKYAYKSKLLSHKDEVIKMYKEDKLSCLKIGKIFGTGDEKVRKYLKRWGIKRRTPSEALLGRKQELSEIKNRIEAIRKNGNFRKSEKTKQILRQIRLGKTYEEIFGQKKAKELKKKASIRSCGKGNPAWDNWKSFEPYGVEFNNNLKEQVRKRDNYTCQECGNTQTQLKYTIPIHHIDFNKRNNNQLNLISLCRSCHSKTQFKRQDWINYYKNKIQTRINIGEILCP